MDRQESGLRGQVKRCRAERNYVYPDHDWIMHTDDTYSPEGHLLERQHRNPGGSHWSVICRYDDRGRLVNKATGDDRYSYSYDSLGRLESVILCPAQARERIFESFRYAADGTKTSTSYPAPLDDEQRKNTSACVQAALHFSVDTTVILTVFDAQDRPARKVLYDRDDRVIRRIVLRYDERGLLASEGESLNGKVRDEFCNLYRYDKLGRRIEATWRWDDLHLERRTFEYNEYGNVREEKIEQDSGLVLLPGFGPQSWAQRFAYRYDEQANWIERSTEIIPRTLPSHVSMLERREFTYY